MSVKVRDKLYIYQNGKRMFVLFLMFLLAHIQVHGQLVILMKWKKKDVFYMWH
jgi:hypothetical protein